MPLMTWDQSLDVGVEEMNAEHREILDAMNEIFDAYQRGTRGDEICTAIVKLKTVCTRHFADEEAFMERTGFPGLAAHKQFHQQLLSTFSQYAEATKSAGGEVPENFFNFLRHWLGAHIKGIDSKYGAHANAQISSAS